MHKSFRHVLLEGKHLEDVYWESFVYEDGKDMMLNLDEVLGSNFLNFSRKVSSNCAILGENSMKFKTKR
jgi:hypothetical protein